MASITTILGTDSVSSSRIVINNNFAALNNELADIAALFNTTTQVLTLTGLITGGALTINNGTIDTFKVNPSDAAVNVPITFNQDVILNNALIHSVYYNIASLPAANAYTYTTYVVDAAAFNGDVITLAAADNGQEITFIANGGNVEFDDGNIAGTGGSTILLTDASSVTLRWIEDLGKFYVISRYDSIV